MSELFYRAGRRRSPATMAGVQAGPSAAQQGRPVSGRSARVEEIIAVMRAAGGAAHSVRLRGLIVILWRPGLRIRAALAVAEADPDPPRLIAGSARQGQPPPRGRDGRVGLGAAAALARRARRASRQALLCMLTGPTRGPHWSTAAARADLRRTAAAAGVRRRCRAR
jgi:hypothetical protein